MSYPVPTVNVSKEPQKSYRCALIGFLGAITTFISTFTPWAKIGGVTRDGLATADIFMGLQESLQIPVGIIGLLWYLSAATMVTLGFTALLGTNRKRRIITRSLFITSLIPWITYIAISAYTGIIKIMWTGPIFALIGAVLIGIALEQKRQGLIRLTH